MELHEESIQAYESDCTTDRWEHRIIKGHNYCEGGFVLFSGMAFVYDRKINQIIGIANMATRMGPDYRKGQMIFAINANEKYWDSPHTTGPGNLREGFDRATKLMDAFHKILDK